jgi:hypothetical protein
VQFNSSVFNPEIKELTIDRIVSILSDPIADLSVRREKVWK